MRDALVNWSVVNLIARPDAIFEEVALLIARDRYPNLSVTRYMGMLDALAEPLRPRLDPELDAHTCARVLTRYVYGELGFEGSRKNYYDPDNSHFNRVLERRKGIPITLAVLLVALGRRLGLRVEGVHFPGRFLAKIGGENGVYVDPFEGGALLDRSGLDLLLQRVMGPQARVRDEHLALASPRSVGVRMLLNLKQVYEQLRQDAPALLVCDRLHDITGDVKYRRDRGLHALALGAREAASQDIEAYLQLRPQASDAADMRKRLESARRVRAIVQ